MKEIISIAIQSIPALTKLKSIIEEICNCTPYFAFLGLLAAVFNLPDTLKALSKLIKKIQIWRKFR